jgi:hypothetical protein
MGDSLLSCDLSHISSQCPAKGIMTFIGSSTTAGKCMPSSYRLPCSHGLVDQKEMWKCAPRMHGALGLRTLYARGGGGRGGQRERKEGEGRRSPTHRTKQPVERLEYRHSFHAGNNADCFKHVLLLILLRKMLLKDNPMTYVRFICYRRLLELILFTIDPQTLHTAGGHAQRLGTL